MTTRNRRRRRGRFIRLPLHVAVLYAVGVTAVVAFTVAGALPVWAAVSILVAAAVALFVPIRGRVVLVEWFTVIASFLRNRRRSLPPELPAAVDVSVISGDAGIRWDGETLVAAVEVAPNLALTREAGGSASTTSVLPLDLVASLMSQYGLHFDIDIVSSGRHVPAGTAYRTVYSQFVGPRHLVGQRRTWLVLRLNVIGNLNGIIERGPSRAAAPKTLAAAAHRVVQRLEQERIRARALSAEELDAMAAAILEPVGAEQNREKWSQIRSGQNFITTYVGAARTLADGQLDQWWSWRTEDAVVTLRLTGAEIGDIQVGALVRYVHHGKAYRPLVEAKLALPTGNQRAMLEAALPAGDRSLAINIATTALSTLTGLTIPIGPSGQILGQLDEGTLIAVPLWDQSAHPQRRRIDAQVGVEVARQLVMRAVVTGAVVAIHTDDRQRWEGLIATVNDPQRLFYATAGARACDIAVFDGRTVTTAPARTVLRLATEDTAPSSSADLTIIEGPGQLLEVTVGAAPPVTVMAIRTREEDRYLGLGNDADRSPRRVVSTAPAVSRRRATPPPPVQSPILRQRPLPPEPAPAPAPDNDRAPARPSPTPSSNPAPVRRHGIVGPQRVTRPAEPAEPTPPRPRRTYHLPPPPSDMPPSPGR